MGYLSVFHWRVFQHDFDMSTSRIRLTGFSCTSPPVLEYDNTTLWLTSSFCLMASRVPTQCSSWAHRVTQVHHLSEIPVRQREGMISARGSLDDVVWWRQPEEGTVNRLYYRATSWWRISRREREPRVGSLLQYFLETPDAQQNTSKLNPLFQGIP